MPSIEQLELELEAVRKKRDEWHEAYMARSNEFGKVLEEKDQMQASKECAVNMLGGEIEELEQENKSLKELNELLLKNAKTCFDWYQKTAMRTMKPLDKREQLLMCAVGLAGEVGECNEHVKKHVFHGKDMDQAALADELGDVLWYLVGMTAAIGWTLESVAQHNIKKLEERHLTPTQA
jgi:NTP pyrophosphatase (non-canonical NTP hydrolase)